MQIRSNLFERLVLKITFRSSVETWLYVLFQSSINNVHLSLYIYYLYSHTVFLSWVCCKGNVARVWDQLKMVLWEDMWKYGEAPLALEGYFNKNLTKHFKNTKYPAAPPRIQGCLSFCPPPTVSTVSTYNFMSSITKKAPPYSVIIVLVFPPSSCIMYRSIL
jgi:hypothetical protein